MYKNLRKILIIFIFSFYSINSQDLDKDKFKISPPVKSIILPGWGQYALEKYSRGNIFFTTETFGIALTLFSFIKSKNVENTFIAIAAEHAAVNESGKNHQYWVDIGNYDSSEEFNDEHLRWREYDSLYPNDELWKWAWDDEEYRKKFEALRIKSDKFDLVGKFIIGGIVINHIISAIDALYLQNVSLTDKVKVVSYYNLNSKTMQYSLQFNL